MHVYDYSKWNDFSIHACSYVQSVGHRSNAASISSLESSCQANLTCSRPNATNAAKGITDIKCTLGACCIHTVPVRGTYDSSPLPEHFALYDLIVNYVKKVSWQKSPPC